MTYSNLMVEVQGDHILVVLRGTVSGQNIENKMRPGLPLRSTGRMIQMLR
jgi:hypothetical protein